MSRINSFTKMVLRESGERQALTLSGRIPADHELSQRQDLPSMGRNARPRPTWRPRMSLRMEMRARKAAEKSKIICKAWVLWICSLCDPRTGSKEAHTEIRPSGALYGGRVAGRKTDQRLQENRHKPPVPHWWGASSVQTSSSQIFLEKCGHTMHHVGDRALEKKIPVFALIPPFTSYGHEASCSDLWFLAKEKKKS